MSLAGCANPVPPSQPVAGAAALLTASPEAPIRWHVYAVEGFAPAAQVLEGMNQTFAVLNGLGSAVLSLSSSALPAHGSEAWTRRELDDLANALRANEGPDPDNRGIRVIYLDGYYQRANGDKAIGVAIFDTAFVFPERIAQAGALFLQTDDPGLDKARHVLAITLHEVGHLIGLVDAGAPMLVPRHPPPEVDPQQVHSDRPESPMYYATIADPLTPLHQLRQGQDPPTTYDALDWDDLRAYQRHLASS